MSEDGRERIAKSHPTWVRGLKYSDFYLSDTGQKSHPTWVRGLKFGEQLREIQADRSHPTWVRGLKFMREVKTALIGSRTPRGCVD